jgi:hypothetical protein
MGVAARPGTAVEPSIRQATAECRLDTPPFRFESLEPGRRMVRHPDVALLTASEQHRVEDVVDVFVGGVVHVAGLSGEVDAAGQWNHGRPDRAEQGPLGGRRAPLGGVRTGQLGPGRTRAGGSGASPSPRSGCSPTWAAPTSSSSAAEPPTCRRGWADPYRWIPEATGLLRAGGDLLFLGHSTLLMTCVPEAEELPAEVSLQRPQFGMHRLEWPDSVGVEFQLSRGDRIRVLRASGFDVVDLVELRPGPRPRAGSRTPPGSRPGNGRRRRRGWPGGGDRPATSPRHAHLTLR